MTDIRDKKDFIKQLILSFSTIAGALLLNYFSYNLAYKSGVGFMLVFWGLVVAGIIMFIQAIGLYRKMGKYWYR